MLIITIKKKIITYHLLNGSMKRRKKIQYIAENILKLKMSNSTKRNYMINKENEFKRLYSHQHNQINKFARTVSKVMFVNQLRSDFLKKLKELDF